MNGQQTQTTTTLGPNDPDDGDTGRQQRGMAIAAVVNIKKNRLGYAVPSQSGNGSYVVNTDGEPFCTCPDFEKRQRPCKHIYAVEFIIRREERPDGTIIETKTMRVTHRQDWPAYNAAQTHEQELFGHLLRELCDAIPQPPQGMGRPRLPLSRWGRMAIVDTKPFKLRVILHRIFVERPQVIGIPAWPGGAACYRRSRYIL